MRNDKKPEKLILLIKKIRMPAETVKSLTQRLAVKGIAVTLLQAGDAPGAEADRLCGEEVLLLCDDAETARGFGTDAVLIYLHEKNRGTDFTGFQYFIEGFEDADAEYFIRTYQRLKGIPWTIADTKRLLVREMVPEDLDAIYELYAYPEEVTYLPPLCTDRKEEAEYLNRYIRNMYGIFEYGMWVILEKETGKLIGRMGVENTDCEDVLSFGFLLHPKVRKRGYATEAGEAVLAYLRENFPQLEVKAFCHPDNEEAIRLSTRLGIDVIKQL